MGKRLSIIVLLLCVGICHAQNTNMAQLVTADTSFVNVSLGVNAAKGPLVNVFDPESEIAGSLDAVARTKVDSIFLFGRFGYGYSYSTCNKWRGWIDPTCTPFMLADSIPGNISLENYSMEAGAARRFGRWSVGLDLAYDVAIMAKHKDLRNKNTLMNFRVAPGVAWNGDILNLGLDLGYERGTEKVEYTQIEENVEHYIFDIYGLWLYYSNGYSSAETKRLKEDDRFFADLQTGIETENFKVHNVFRASNAMSVQGETGYNNLRHGDVRYLGYSDRLDIGICKSHLLSAYWSTEMRQGSRYLQRQELDPASKIRTWVTYGDPVNCYYRRVDVYGVNYTYGQNWAVTVGVDNVDSYQSYNEYPQKFYQCFKAIMPSLTVRMPVSDRLTLSPTVGAYSPYSCDRSEDDSLIGAQLQDPLNMEWSFWTGTCHNMNLSATYLWDNMYLSGSVRCVESQKFTYYRLNANLTLGFIF